MKTNQNTADPQKKLKPQSSGEVLLTSRSSRRKSALQRLKSTEDRGLTLDQVGDYLKRFMKQFYDSVEKKGALSQDKIDKYLEYLSKTAAIEFAETPIDPTGVSSYMEQVEPVLEELATKDTLTEEDIASHTATLKNKAKQHIETIYERYESEEITPEIEEEDSEEADDDELIIPELEDPEEEVYQPKPLREVKPEPTAIEPKSETTDSYNESEKSEDLNKQEASDPGTLQTEISPEEDKFIEKEIIPVGFEEGVPTVSIKDFLSFPLALSEEKGPDPDAPFACHLRFLKKAVKKKCFDEKTLERIEEICKSMPAPKYSRYINIFPDNIYEDAKLMITFTQWKNGVFDNLRIDV